MGMVENLIGQLAESEAVKDAMAKFVELRTAVINAASHFNKVLETHSAGLQFIINQNKEIAESQKQLHAKLDTITEHLFGDPMVKPAGNDNLLCIGDLKECMMEGCMAVVPHDHLDGKGLVVCGKNTPKSPEHAFALGEVDARHLEEVEEVTHESEPQIM